MLADKTQCTGCAACYSICKFGAIEMIADKTGFLYPVINKELCTNCGLCNKACPIISPVTGREEGVPQTFIFQHNNDTIRKESTSGGAFTAIAEYVINKNGIVFGASFDENWCVRHTCAEKLEDLAQFRNSKYVQSEIRDTYKEAKGFLESGRWVCFSGTPCQIHGLVKYLGKEYEKLVTVDLICLAVPSPKIFKKYLELREKQVSDIKKYGLEIKTWDILIRHCLLKGKSADTEAEVSPMNG